MGKVIRAYADSDATPPLARLAARQHGVVTVHQLKRLGIASDAIATRIRHGHLVRIHKGVYAVGHLNLTAKGRWLGAVMACGPGALLSHRAAAALWELLATPTATPDVTSPKRRAHPGVRCHRCSTLQKLDGTVISGIPVTSLARTLLDLAEVLTSQRLRSVLEASQRREILDFDRVDDVLKRNNGRQSCGRLRAALDELGETAPWTQSVLEQRFLELLREAELPQPQTKVTVDGYVVDCFWPEHNLVVELDSYGYHRSRRAFEDDRRKDTVHALAGRGSVRISRERVENEAESLQNELRTLLAAARPSAARAARRAARP